MTESSSDSKPQVGDRFKHPTMRHTWKVQTVGRTYITLKAEFPNGATRRVPVGQWPRDMDGDWTPA